MQKSPRNSTRRSLRYQAFAYLYRQFSLPLMKFIVKKMGANTDAAEEVFSQTIEAALKGWDTFRHKSSYFTWICRIALNKMADYWRHQVNEKSKLVAPAFEELAKIGTTDLAPDEKLVLEELQLSVKDCLNLLPEDKRKLLYLRYWEELTYQEIAMILGITERAVEGQLYRAKQSLRIILEERHPNILG